MKKFLAVVKREYMQRVRTKMFVFMTVLGPALLAVLTIVPGVLFSIKAGGDTRIAILDQTEGAALYQAIRISLLKQDYRENARDVGVMDTVNSNAQARMEETGKSLTGSFSVEQVNLNGKSLEDVKRELSGRIGKNELDGYLILPPDILRNGNSRVAYYGRNVGDLVTREQIEERLDRAIRRQRLIKQGVKEQEVDALSKPIMLTTYPVNEKGEEGAKDSGAGFIMVFVISFLIYLTVLMYGQMVLGSVVEEKETRIAEILFSSVRSFTLMFGKLIGVSLVALTQLAIWGVAFALLALWGLSALTAGAFQDINIPHLPPVFFLYFFLFFVLGYFIYATLYVLIGSMVTTTQEGGQLAMPVVFLLMAGLYMAFPVIRSSNSPFAVWISMVPFFAPITMMVRIVSQTPPLWQIALSLLIGVFTIILLLWLASRIYRTGMLMHGKKTTLPEVWRWVRQT